MRLLLIACAGAVALGGCSLGGHDASQVVHKDPAAVYQALNSAFSDIADQGNSGLAAERGQQTSIERVENQSIELKTTIDGKPALHLRFGFEPANGGAATTLTGDLEIDQQVLREKMRKDSGGEVALPAVPGFALDMVMQKLLAEMAQKIDAGEPLDSHRAMALANGPRAEIYQTGSDWERSHRASEYERQMAQQQASAPMMDPDAAARNYMGGR